MIAYLVLAHHDPAGLAALVNALRSRVSGVFIHLDAKSPINRFDTAGATFVTGRHRVHRAEWSVVAATLTLIDAALIDPRSFTHFALLSGQDHPLSTPDMLLTFLQADGRERIDALPMPAPANRKPLSRLSARRIEGRLPGWGARPLGRLSNAALGLLPHRDVAATLAPWLPHAGGQWWVLSRDAVTLACNAARAGGPAMRMFQTSSCPDESFFQTLLLSRLPADRVAGALTFADWSAKGASPALLDDRHIHRITRPGFLLRGARGGSPCFFARKVPVGATDLRTRLDNYAATRSPPSTSG